MKYPSLLLLLALLPGIPATAAEIVVTTSSNLVDFAGQQRATDLPGPDNEVSLHEAMIAANNTPGPDNITFDLDIRDTRIRVQTPLPVLSDNGTTISGPLSQFGDPIIELEEAIGLENSTGFRITGISITLRGLVISFDFGVEIYDNAANNTIESCHIGSNITSASSIGVWLRDGVTGNRIGTIGAGNVFNRNFSAGVLIEDELTNNNRIVGNVFGEDLLTPNGVGVLVRRGALANTIGGLFPGEGNVFGASHRCAIELTDAIGNLIYGNEISGSGADEETNFGGGILVQNTPDVFINGNTIYENNGPGIRMESCRGGRVEQNVIGGESFDGGNVGGGIVLIDSTDIVVGVEGLGNIILNNSGPGVLLGPGTTGTIVVGNEIGVEEGNTGSGVEIQSGSSGNFIGGMNVGGMNLIDNNAGHGVYIESGASENSVRYNRISGNALGSLTLEPGANGGIQPPNPDRSFPAVSGTAPPLSLIDIYTSSTDDPDSALVWVETAFAFENGEFTVLTPTAQLGDLILLTATGEGENTSAFVRFCLVGDCGFGRPEATEPVNPALGIIAPFFCVDGTKARGPIRQPAPDTAAVLLGVPAILIATRRKRN